MHHASPISVLCAVVRGVSRHQVSISGDANGAGGGTLPLPKAAAEYFKLFHEIRNTWQKSFVSFQHAAAAMLGYVHNVQEKNEATLQDVADKIQRVEETKRRNQATIAHLKDDAALLVRALE